MRPWPGFLLFVAACGSGSNGDAAAGDASSDAPSSDAAVEAPESGGDDATRDAAASDASSDGSFVGDAPAATDAADASDGSAAQAIAIPMYVDPSTSASLWGQVNAAAPTVALLVANPASGPGTAAETQYTQAIAAAHAAGQSVVGYVHTSYAMRALSQVTADVDAWYSFYPDVDGIFVDETSTDPTTVGSYYSALYGDVKKEPGTRAHTVVINPGTNVDESFMQACDIVVDFEDVYANYKAGVYPGNPPWVASYPRWRFWHLVLSAASPADLQDAVTLARQRNAGYLYVTDQGPSTAYQQIVTGTYWQAELTVVGTP